MEDGLRLRIQRLLDQRGLTAADLEEFLRSHGINYRLPFVESFAEPAHVRIIARFVRVNPSSLFEFTRYAEDFALAVLEESWPSYSGLVGMPFDEVRSKVQRELEFRGQGYVGIRQHIEMFLDALSPPVAGGSLSDCYIDCERCVTRCRRTGRMLDS